MGCTSSASTAGTVSSAKGAKKGCINACIDLWYFEFCGRADPIAQMFEYHGQQWKKTSWTQENWGAAKARNDGKCGEFNGGLPQVKFTVGGKAMDCSGLSAILHMFGVKFGYYDPKNWKEAGMIDPVVETFGDVIGAIGGVAFAQDDAAKTAALEKFTKITTAFLGLVSKYLNCHQGKFLCGNKVTIADFIMASFFGNLVKNSNCPLQGVCAGLVDSNPRMKSYCDNICNEMTYLKTRGPIGPF